MCSVCREQNRFLIARLSIGFLVVVPRLVLIVDSATLGKKFLLKNSVAIAKRKSFTF